MRMARISARVTIGWIRLFARPAQANLAQLMRNPSSQQHLLLRVVSRYSIALVTVAAAVGLRLLMQRFIENESMPFLLLFAAVLVSAASGGLGPGLLATV